MVDVTGIEDLEAQVDALEQSLGGAQTMVSAFDAELGRMQGNLNVANQGVAKLSGSIGGGLRRAFDGLVFDGLKLSDALKQVASTIIDATYAAAIKPITGHLGGLIGQGVESFITGSFAKGASFSQGRVQPFARGGVVTAPTTFPMRGGTGLMGEAGPEAILPLARGPDGALGVRSGAGSGRPVQVIMNISTPDVQGFQRSQSQIAAQMTRVLGRGKRNR